MANTGNTQQQINYGAAVNDGNGDPLRTAFIKTDDNFDNVWLAGPVGSNITITNNTVQVNNTNGNLILSPNGVGVIQTNSRLLPRLNNTYDFGSTTLKYRTGYFGAGGLVIDGNVTVAGNLTAGNIAYTGNVFVGDLQGSVYADDSTIMVDAVDNELFAGRATISGNVSGTYFIGNGSLLTGIATSYGNANVVANLAALGNNPISTTGNVTANYFLGNGRQLTGVVSSYGNSNVAAYLTTYTGNLAAGNLNVSSGSDSWTMTGQFLTGPGGAYWHSHPEQSSDDFVSAPGSDIRIQSVDANSVVASQISLTGIDIELIVVNGVTKTWRFNESGTSEIPGDIVPVVTLGASASVGNIANPWDNAYISGNINSGNVSAAGNVTASYFIGNGSQLTGIATSYGNANVVANLAALGSNPVSTTGNVTASYFIGNGSQLTSLPAPAVTQDISSNGAMSIMTYDGVIKYVSYATVEPASGNLTVGNISTTGNISGNYFVGNGSQLTGISVANTGNVTFTDTTISTNSAAAGIDVFLRGGTATGCGASGGNSIILSGLGGGINQIGSGNVVIKTGNSHTNIWTFDAAGNLNLPGNTFAVNYANGTPVSIGGGGNTGNVTFNDVNIIGDGNLYLQPDPANAGSYLDIFLTTGPDLHLVANNANLILGTDEEANVAILTDGNVAIQAGNVGGTHTWNFGRDGTLTLPGNTIAINYLNGNLAFGTVTFSDEAVIGTGTSNTVSGLYLAPDPVSLANDLYLRVRGNIQDEPTHIHFDTGNNQYYNQFIGDDNKYIQLANTGYIVINASDYAANTAQWTFGTDGNLTFPSNNFTITPNLYDQGGFGLLANNNANLAMAALGSTNYVDLFWADDIANTTEIAGIQLSGPNDAYGNILLYTYSPDGQQVWNFDKTGNLAAPGNISAVGNITSGYFVGDGSQLTNIVPTDWANIGNLTNNNGPQTIAIGAYAGEITQGSQSVAIGVSAGQELQGNIAIAIGGGAGSYNQSDFAVAVGGSAGFDTQGNSAVAVGYNAGFQNQGEYAVALGRAAGDTNQGNNSIIINATGGILDQTTANTFTVAPIRNDVANVAEILFYDTTSKEITYGNTISVAGNITGNYILGNGSQLTSVNAETVDVTDTNGLTTVYYPTFVENRTTAQIARADVDLTYRTDDNLLTVGNVSVTGNVTGNTAGFAIGYRDIPQVAFTANATIAATDAGKHFYSTESTDYILTIANNASQGFQTGAAITVVNQGTGNIILAQGSGVTLYLTGNATSGNRTVTTFGMATLIKVATDTWFASGSGVI